MSTTRPVITGVGLITGRTPDGITGLDDLLGDAGVRVRRSAPWRRGVRCIDVAEADVRAVAANLPAQRLRTLPDEAVLLQAAARQALAQAGLDICDADQDRVGVAVSTQHAGLANCAEVLTAVAADERSTINPTRGAQTGYNAPAGQLSIRLGLTGPNVTLIGGPAGGIDTLLHAVDELAAGHADVMLVCGVDVVSPATIAALDTAAPWPPRPFDRGRRGPAYGSVAAVLVLETHAGAVQRGASVLGEVRSAATAFSPVGELAEAAGRALRDALWRAETPASRLAGCLAGANGSVAGDAAERRALRRILGDAVPVSAVKGHIGECAGAAAVAELAVAALALARGRLPGTAGFRAHDAGPETLGVSALPVDLDSGPVLVHAWDEDGAAGAAVIGPAP